MIVTVDNARHAPVRKDISLKWGYVFAFLLPLVWIEPAPVDVYLLLLLLVMLGRPKARLGLLFWVLAPLYVGLLLIPMARAGYSMTEQGFAIGLRSIFIDISLIGAGVALYWYSSTSEDHLRSIFFAVTYSAGCLALGLLAVRFLIAPGSQWLYSDSSLTRLKGTFEDPNVLGPFMSIGILGAFVLPRSTSRELLMNTILGAASAVVLVLTLSRGGVLAAGVSLVSLVLLRSRTTGTLFERAKLTRSRGYTGVRFVLCLLVSLGLLIAVFQFGGSFVSDRFAAQEYDTGEQGRFYFVGLGLETALANPLGFGSGRFLDLYGTVPHNLWIGKAVDAGLAAAGILLLALTASLRAVVQAMRRTPNGIYVVVFALLVGHLSVSLFIYSHHWRHFIFLGALAFASRKIARSAERP